MNNQGLIALLLLLAAGGSPSRAAAEQAAPPPPSARAPRVLAPPARPSVDQVVGEIVQRFAAVYARRGSPRIGIYWNRQVDDMLSQWESERRTVTRQDGSRTENGPAPARSHTEQVTTEQRGVTRPPGNDLSSQAETWDAHEGFLEPLLAARARLVDRAAIQRLTASDPSAQRSVSGADRQAVEMNALREYADLWVEITAGNPATDRRMRAVVKDVRTGSILAYVTAPGGPAAVGDPRAYRPTPRGFEPVEEMPPSPRQVSMQLSVNLMDALVAQWAP